MPRKTLIQVRRDTASNWTTVNPVLAAGEIGFETNTNKMKIGDGTTVWSSLPYQGGSSSSLPTGGTSGQILTKNSSTNYDASWQDNISAIQKLQTYVLNDEATTITKGTAVYTSGANGTNVLVKRALATSDTTSARTLGLAASDIPANGGGYIITDGLLSGIDTSAGNAGDIVFLSGVTAGALVFGIANKPYAPTHLVYLGVITKKSAGTGEILVKVQNGYELDEIHNVDNGHSKAMADGDILSYESSTSLWKNKTLSGAGIAAAVHTHAGTDIVSGTIGFSYLPTGTTSSTVAIGNHNHSLDSLSNITITSKATNDLIQWNGTAWVNKTLAGAGLITSVSGTTNQVTASTTTGAVTVSLPSAVTISGAMTAGSFVKSGGTSSQFLKADGSVDSSTYLTTAVTSLAGTTNQVSVSGSTGSVTVSLPSSVTISGTMTAGTLTGSTVNSSSSLAITSTGLNPVTVNTPTSSTLNSSSGAITIQSGNFTGGGVGSAGTITIDTGTSNGLSSTVNIGNTNAGTVAIGRSGQTTNLNGNITINSAAGSAGQVLTSNGAGSAPTWGAISAVGLTGSNYVAAGILSANQSISVASTDTQISFVDYFDPQNWWDPSTKKFTPNIPGYYSITLNVLWSALSSTNQTNAQIRKNGNSETIQQRSPDANIPYFMAVTKIIYLNGTTDYIDFTVWSPVTTQSLQQGNASGSGTNFSAALVSGSPTPFVYTPNSNQTLTNNTSAQSPFGLTNGISLISGNTYEVEMLVYGTCGTTSGQLQFYGATTTATQLLWSYAWRGAASTPTTAEARIVSSGTTLSNVTSAGTGAVYGIMVVGRVVATSTGYWNPLIGFSVATGSAPTVLGSSYVKVTLLGTSATPTNIGNWS